jgi:hypothetical protein
VRKWRRILAERERENKGEERDRGGIVYTEVEVLMTQKDETERRKRN